MSTKLGQNEDWPTIFNPATCTRRGLCPITEIRRQSNDPFESHSIYYEQHGTGNCKIVFIMGLNSSSFSWVNQVNHFGSSDQYSVLVFDNRGVGNSDYPRGPYTTSGMAEDLITLLEYVGWTALRDIHVVGISMGGMIAQELASKISERIVSLTLVVTTPGGRIWDNFPPWKGLVSLTKLLFTADPIKQAPIIAETLFPSDWLDKKSEEAEDNGKTNRQVQIEVFLRRVAITRPQNIMGHISQLIAALTHNVNQPRLSAISKSIPKVTILTGDDDNLVDPRHSYDIKACMPEAEFVQWQGVGHEIHMQKRAMFNALLEKAFEEGKKRCST